MLLLKQRRLEQMKKIREPEYSGLLEKGLEEASV